MRLSELTHSGMNSLIWYSFAAAIIARAIPVLPDVGSSMILSWVSCPDSSALLIM